MYPKLLFHLIPVILSLINLPIRWSSHFILNSFKIKVNKRGTENTKGDKISL